MSSHLSRLPARLAQTTFDCNDTETYAEWRERLAHERCYEQKVKLAEARQRRLERMAQLTAEFMGDSYDCDILFAA